ncbi:hypothetical protein H2203_002322 [Taxawa tesnikishii (nom. ined.)]|nr:hypothetical protein H2203_002322 [Dothideales sp. JES 119]
MTRGQFSFKLGLVGALALPILVRLTAALPVKVTPNDGLPTLGCDSEGCSGLPPYPYPSP